MLHFLGLVFWPCPSFSIFYLFLGLDIRIYFTKSLLRPFYYLIYIKFCIRFFSFSESNKSMNFKVCVQKGLTHTGRMINELNICLGQFLNVSLLPFPHSIHFNVFAIHLFLQYLLRRLARHYDRWWKITILTLEWCFTAYRSFMLNS